MLRECLQRLRSMGAGETCYLLRFDKAEDDRAPSTAAGIMNEEQIADFIRHFERITRHNRDAVSRSADVVIELDGYHECVASHYRD